MRIYLAVILILISIVACKGKKDAVEDAKSGKMLKDATNEIKNKYWKLVELNGETVKYNENIKTIHLTFHENGLIDGCLGCNKFRGDYTIDEKNNLKISNLIGTKMFCEQASEIEKEIIKILNLVNNYKINKDGTLSINNDSTTFAKFVVIYMI
jgi:heat shock protein HslJ